MRLSVSAKANERLIARRLRALLRIQLGDDAEVDPRPVGSLAEELIYIWIDVPQPRLALIEVRGHAMALGRRTLVIADFPADVAARVVAIEASEMVRVQAAAARARRDVRPEPAGPPSMPRLSDGDGVGLVASFDAAWLPTATPRALGGVTLAVEHRQRFTTQTVYFRHHGGFPGGQAIRWLEVGAGFDVAFALHPTVRLNLGGRAGVAAVGLPGRSREDDRPGADDDGDDLTVRLTGSVAVETPLAPSVWLGVRLEPGAIVRPLDLALTDEQARITGFVGGGSLSLRVSPPW
ncbi:MAG: hypothetical protein AAGN82_06305 [Myxococcota bacterium]